ncbi:MAG: hypothetical protein LN412_04740 [Candidatus Thermoplasmatota archaeon]|nr:hypothetical protein [Candidatus Thermoplasmatota archaeon]
MGLWSKVNSVLTGAKEKSVDGANEVVGSIIPGYDYRMKRVRLDTDIAVREKLTRELEKSLNTLKEIGSLAYKDERRDILDHLKDVTNTIDLFRMEIANAEYGMSTFFKNDEASYQDIRRMIEFDAKMLDEIEVVSKASDLLYDGVLEGKTADFVSQIVKVKRSVDSARNQFKDRKDFLISI